MSGDLLSAARCRQNRSYFAKAAVFAGALGAVCTAWPALADTESADVVSTNVPTIIVENNGSEYTHVTNSSQSIIGEIQVKIDAEVTGRVKSFEAWPMLGPLKGTNLAKSWEHFKDSGYSKSYSVPRPKSVTESFNFEIKRQEYADLVVAVCNIHADKLRSQGKKNSEIFSKNRTVAFAVEGTVDAELTGPERVNPPPVAIGPLYTLSVTCKRDDALDPVAAPQVEGAYMQAKAGPKDLRGTCELELNGSVITRDPNTEVRFVYVDDKGNVSDLKTVTTSGEANTTFKHKFPISAKHKSGKIRMVGQSHPFFSNWATFESDCSEQVDDIKTVLPPKAVSVEAYATADNVVHDGRNCPAKAKVWGVLKGRGEASGFVIIRADGKLKVQEQFQAKDGKDIVVQGEHALSWEGNQTGKQSVDYRMDIVDAGGAKILETMEKSVNFECRKPQVTGAVQGGPGGLTTGNQQWGQSPQAAQQNAQVAVGDLAIHPNLAILAPKGRTRRGQIRLSGAKPGDTYVLTFMRGVAPNQYQEEKSPQLPRRMTGSQASFPLAALAGSRRWLLYVCRKEPAGQPNRFCAKSKFEIGGAKTTGTQQPQPQPQTKPQQPPSTKVFIIPGVDNPN
ncbi:hypothetical protein [Pelagibius marinus]|uniref:hypothetical protein n=1 Tax=Pelagibius marinus TaxID=2762760 RepID=UPI00187255A4|nr:hypothetical protein [Pelagibius marinus]